MRVSELANELGKTSKEVLDIIKQKDSSAALFAASSVSKDQENMVRNAVSQKKEGKTEPAKKRYVVLVIAFGHKRSRPAMGGSKCFSCCLLIVFFVGYG